MGARLCASIRLIVYDIRRNYTGPSFLSLFHPVGLFILSKKPLIKGQDEQDEAG